MKTTSFFTIAVCAGFISSCAATVPRELLNAREANLRASKGPAATVAPAELHVANQALAAAEQSFQQDPDAYQTRDLAYVAQRKAELATATASIINEQKSQAQAKADYQATQGKIIAKTKSDLGQTRGALAASERTGEATERDLSQTRSDLAASERSGDRTAEQLEMERQARVASETKLAGAMKASLTKAAYVFNALPSKAVRTVDALREKQESAA